MTQSLNQASKVEEMRLLCRRELSGDGELLAMMQGVDIFGRWLASSGGMECIALCAAFPLAAVAVLLIDDRYKLMRRMQREASVAALEALYALPDMRDCRRSR